MWLHVGDFTPIFILHFPPCVWCSLWVFPSHVCPSWAASPWLTMSPMNKLQAWRHHWGQLCSESLLPCSGMISRLRPWTWDCLFQVSICDLIAYMSALVCTRINIVVLRHCLGWSLRAESILEAKTPSPKTSSPVEVKGSRLSVHHIAYFIFMGSDCCSLGHA